MAMYMVLWTRGAPDPATLPLAHHGRTEMAAATTTIERKAAARGLSVDLIAPVRWVIQRLEGWSARYYERMSEVPATRDGRPL